MSVHKAFLLGTVGYPVLELLYRGHTHYSMALAGGLSACLIDRVSQMPGGLLLKSALCGLGVTGVEYFVGQVWNRQHQVWDYRRMPLNFQGQICLPYSLLWCGLSAALLLALRKRRT